MHRFEGLQFGVEGLGLRALWRIRDSAAMCLRQGRKDVRKAMKGLQGRERSVLLEEGLFRASAPRLCERRLQVS